MYFLCTCVYICARITVQGWRSEDSLQESVLSFDHVGPGNWAWLIRLGSKSPLPADLAHGVINFSPQFCVCICMRRPEEARCPAITLPLGRLSGWQLCILPGSSCLCPLSLLPCLDFYWVLGSQLRSWCLSSKHSYPSSHLSNRFKTLNLHVWVLCCITLLFKIYSYVYGCVYVHLCVPGALRG